MMLILFILSSFLQAQGLPAIVKGRITDLEGDGLAGGNVLIENTLIGSSTDTDGYFELKVAPEYYKDRTIKITARYIGYRALTKEVNLKEGENIIEFILEEDLLNMEAIVVTGLAGQTTKEKTPFSISVIKDELLEAVPAATPSTALQGKIAGVQVVKGSGKPGQGASVMLRGATSISTAGNIADEDDPMGLTSKTQDPIYIVDGTILAGTPDDLDAGEIESMEVIKGAAASSLYGSRAANGVIQIRTKRGANIAMDKTRIKMRSEYGVNALANDLNYSKNHKYLASTTSYTDNNGAVVEPGDWIDTNGNKVDRINRLLNGGIEELTFKDGKYNKTYDHTDQAYRNGEFMTNSVSISRNMQNTNFLASINNYKNTGIVRLNDGYERNTFKLNLDHKLRPNMQLSMSAQYGVSKSDNIDENGNQSRSPLEELAKFEPDVDLTAKDANGDYLFQPDEAAQNDNPLYYLQKVQNDLKKERLVGHLEYRYFPTEWLDFEANLSLDREELRNFIYYPKGFQSSYNFGLQDGRLMNMDGTKQAINASATAGVRKTFGDFNTRAKFRYLYEDYDNQFLSVQADSLRINGMKTWANAAGNKIVQSIKTSERDKGFYFISGVDYQDKYIIDFLLRRDGSSLFGENERYHSYYRLSGAWRLSEEPFWVIKDYVNEFKLHYSRGTAGSRPNFQAQYQTYQLGLVSISQSTLGNPDLKPEFATENEFGLSAGILDKFSLELTYANTVVDDQIMLVPNPSFTFPSKWANAGALESNSFEATLEGNVFSAGGHNLSFGFTFDRTRSKITRLDVPSFQYGFGQDGNQFQIDEGVEIGTMYGRKWARNVEDLPEDMQEFADQFQVNDDGYLVPVGQGNSWQDGIANDLWNTNVDVDGDGVDDYDWGEPIVLRDTLGNVAFKKLGRTTPDFNLGFNTTYHWKGLTLYMLWNAQIGGKIYNFNKLWMYTTETHADLDQAGKAEGSKKPLSYYNSFTGGGATDETFVEDGTFYKLRELAISYSLNRRQLQPIFNNLINRVTFTLTGRNLLTFSDYDGYDPEVGIGGSTSGSSVIGRVDDDVSYPNYRTYTFSVGLEF